MCHPHTLTQDPERLLQVELEDMGIGPDQEAPPEDTAYEDAPVSDPETVQAPA